MSEFKQSELIRTALEGVKDIVAADTVLGTPFITADGTTIIPVTKVSVGLATGGLDYFSKHQPAPEKNPPEKLASFGGGGGTGISVTPIGFLIVKDGGKVDLLTVDNCANKPTAVNIAETVVDVIERSPELAGKVKEAISKFTKKKDKEDKETGEDIRSSDRQEQDR